MKAYQSKYTRSSGSSYHEIETNARKIYTDIKRKSKRKPYIRSKYLNNQKIFVDYYWEHLNQKPRKERFRRLPYYKAGIDLLQNTTVEPIIKLDLEHSNQTLLRFYGRTAEGITYCVQVKQYQNGQKHLMSIFPYK